METILSTIALTQEPISYENMIVSNLFIISVCIIIYEYYTAQWRKLDALHRQYLKLNEIEESIEEVETSILKELIFIHKNFRKIIDSDQYTNIIIELYRRGEIQLKNVISQINMDNYSFIIDDKNLTKIRQFADKDLTELEGIKREIEFLEKIKMIDPEIGKFIVNYHDTHSNCELKLLFEMMGDVIIASDTSKFLCSVLE